MPSRTKPWGWLGYDGVRGVDFGDQVDAMGYALSSTRDPTARVEGDRYLKTDFYETSAWCVHRLLDLNILPKTGHWLEPGAGKGSIIRAVNSWGMNDAQVPFLPESHRYTPKWTAVEINSGHGRELQAALDACGSSGVRIHDDFIRPQAPQWTQTQPFDVTIGNPPFSLALDFIKESLHISKTVAFLLRLNFFGSVKRHEFFRNWMPDIYVLPNRPSFSEDGATDSIEYAWFVWNQETMDQRVGRIALLDLTPAAERRR